MPDSIVVPTLELERNILVSLIKGRWLLDHTTPSWRLTNPIEGFQRIVKAERAQDIALAVLAQHRPFPNAIVLATDVSRFPRENGGVRLPATAKFLVVDGQHRLWAQSYSSYEATYACLIHLGLTEVEMAKLFLEINNNQKRVPPSLRWDLVRLIQPEDDPFGLSSAEIVYELATEEGGPLYQRVDLTGEQGQITLKQASLAPEIKTVLEGEELGTTPEELDVQYSIFRSFFSGIRAVDPDAWDEGSTPLQQNRVMRAVIRLLPHIVRAEHRPARSLRPEIYARYLGRIDLPSLDPERIRAMQGSAGILAIFNTVYGQVFPGQR